MRPGTVGAEWENGDMETRQPTIEELEFAEQFFKEMGVPFAFHVDPMTGQFHAWAIDVVDLELGGGGARSVPQHQAPGLRRRRPRR